MENNNEEFLLVKGGKGDVEIRGRGRTMTLLLFVAAAANAIQGQLGMSECEEIYFLMLRAAMKAAKESLGNEISLSSDSIEEIINHFKGEQ